MATLRSDSQDHKQERKCGRQGYLGAWLMSGWGRYRGKL